MAVIIYKGVRYDTLQQTQWAHNALATLNSKAAVQPSPTKEQGDITTTGIAITDNGTYTAPEGQAYKTVSVSVPQPTLTTLNVTANGTYTGKFSEVNVDVPDTPIPTEYQDAYDKVQTITTGERFTTNGTKTGLFENPQVLVPTTSEIGVTLNVTEGGSYTKEPDTGYTYNKVVVDIPTAKFTYHALTMTGEFENIDIEAVV